VVHSNHVSLRGREGPGLDLKGFLAARLISRPLRQIIRPAQAGFFIWRSGASRLRGLRRDSKRIACKRFGGLPKVGESLVDTTIGAPLSQDSGVPIVHFKPSRHECKPPSRLAAGLEANRLQRFGGLPKVGESLVVTTECAPLSQDSGAPVVHFKPSRHECKPPSRLAAGLEANRLQAIRRSAEGRRVPR
jgi:hypothetical protein